MICPANSEATILDVEQTTSDGYYSLSGADASVKVACVKHSEDGFGAPLSTSILESQPPKLSGTSNRNYSTNYVTIEAQFTESETLFGNVSSDIPEALVDDTKLIVPMADKTVRLAPIPHTINLKNVEKVTSVTIDEIPVG